MSTKSLYEIIAEYRENKIKEGDFIILDYVSDCMIEATKIIDHSMNMEQKRDMLMIVLSGVLSSRGTMVTNQREAYDLIKIVASDAIIDAMTSMFLAGVGIAAREELR